jgi:hypothetical protein
VTRLHFGLAWIRLRPAHAAGLIGAPHVYHDLGRPVAGGPEPVGPEHLLDQALDRVVLGVDGAGDLRYARVAGTVGQRAEQRRAEPDPLPAVADADRELG